MVELKQRLMTFEEFLDWYSEDGNCYELMGGEVILVRPRGEHEEVTSLLTRKLDREIERLDLPWFIPRTCCVKPGGNWDGYVPDLVVLDRVQLRSEPLWEKASTITGGQSARLVVEVASTNWQDDYEDYELLGIPEYWIVDYRALGIGSPKQPTVSVYTLVNGMYEAQKFRGEKAIISSIFPELDLMAAEILAIGE